MTAIEDRHARFLTSIRPRLDQLAPLMVSEHGRGFWAVLDPPRDGHPLAALGGTEAVVRGGVGLRPAGAHPHVAGVGRRRR